MTESRMLHGISEGLRRAARIVFRDGLQVQSANLRVSFLSPQCDENQKDGAKRGRKCDRFAHDDQEVAHLLDSHLVECVQNA